MQIHMDDMVKSKISGFCQNYSQYRDHILNLLEKEMSNMHSTIGEFEEKIVQYGWGVQKLKDSEKVLKEENDSQEGHLSTNAKVGILDAEMNCLQLGINDNRESMQYLVVSILNSTIGLWIYYLLFSHAVVHLSIGSLYISIL